MNIYSWNVSTYNKDLESVVNFIASLDFDVLCLQKVPLPLLEKLQSLGYQTAHFTDLKRIFDDGEETYYLIILTKHKIAQTNTFYISQGLEQPLRTRILVSVMKHIYGWSGIDDHGALCADIRIPKTSVVRVCTTHLRNDGPLERLKEFETVLKHLSPEISSIICGDFNIVDSWFLKPFNWLMGASSKEALPWFSERALFEKLFKKHHLYNPLSKKNTFTLFPGQLDHILIPENWKARRVYVVKRPYGSDHYPVFVEASP